MVLRERGATVAEIAGISLFAGLPSVALADLPTRIRVMRFDRGETVLEHGSHSTDVFVLLEGQLLAKRLSASGQEFGYRRIPINSYFGELAALDGGPRSVSIIALSEARVGMISASDFNAILADWPSVAQTVLTDMARRIRELSDRLFEARTTSITGRVAAQVMRMSLAARVTGNDGVVPDMPTHAEMAALVGGQRETVTRAFNRLVDANIVARQGRNLQIRDFEALLALTEE